MSTSKHVAFFLPDMRGGGAEKATANLANQMARVGVRVDVVLMKAEGVFLSDLDASVRVIDLRTQRFIQSIPRFAHYLRAEKPDAIHSQMFDTTFFAAAARRMAGVRPLLVSTIHSTLSVQAKESETRTLRGAKRKLTRILSSAVHKWDVDQVVTVSQGVADDFSLTIGFPRDRIKVVHNSIDIDSINASAKERVDHPWFTPGQPPVFLGAGRLHEAKGFDVLIRAFAAVRRENSCRLMILGEGPDRAALELLATSLGVAGDVSLEGFIKNPYPYMNACFAFVLSSRREGLPTVLIEALALGKPVIATDCRSGPSEILEGGKYGALVPEGNVTALAQAMAKIFA